MACTERNEVAGFSNLNKSGYETSAIRLSRVKGASEKRAENGSFIILYNGVSDAFGIIATSRSQQAQKNYGYLSVFGALRQPRSRKNLRLHPKFVIISFDIQNHKLPPLF